MLPKRGKREAQEIAAQLGPWLRARGHESLVVGDGLPDAAGTSVEEEELGDQIDLLVVLGGDGTLLRGAGLVADRGVPLLGVNLGHLGFLTSCSPADARVAVERALAGELPREERMRLECRLRRESGEEVVKAACNDAVLSQGALAR